MKHNNSKGQVTAQVDLQNMRNSGFDMDNVQYGTGRIGRLYPVGCDSVYPDDNYISDVSAVLNFKPLLVPLMTNLYIKQEKFYVPYNTIFENWDLFISNGEENDYNGVVPSVSLRDMMSAFMRIVTSTNYPLYATGYGLPISLVDQTSSTQTDITDWAKYRPFLAFVGSKSVDASVTSATGASTLNRLYNNFDFTKTPFYQFLKTYQMEDLYDHVQPLVKQIYTIIEDAYSTQFDTPYTNPNISYGAGEFQSVALFRPVNSYGLIPGGLLGYSSYYQVFDSGAVTNKYFAKIYKALDKYAAYASLSANEMFVPTETGFAVLRCLYDIYKTCFGLSSHLDMLNYNKLKFEDFLYNIILNVNDKFDNDVFNDDEIVNVGVSSSFLTSKPKRILELRALYSIWLNNYRDQLLEKDAFALNKTETITDEEIVVLLTPRLRCWHKDAFTTALDNAGTGSVGVPVGLQAANSMYYTVYNQYVDTSLPDSARVSTSADGNTVYKVEINGQEWKVPSAYLSGINPHLDKYPYTSSGFSLYQLDAARRAQSFLQKALFYGNRIQDFLFTHWGVKFLDARLRLPELLSTSSDMVDMQAIVANNTVVTEMSTNVAGDKAGYAYGMSKNNDQSHYISEHGVVITMLSVIPDVVYSNSCDRHLAMLDQLDYPFPEFATLGLQAVYEDEMMQIPCLIPQENDEFNDDVPVHGYQGMYFADKSKFSCVHGELLDTENVYVMDREFNPYDLDERPKLNHIFVHCHPKLDAFVIDNEWSDYFRFDVYHNYKANRKLPVHSVYIN